MTREITDAELRQRVESMSMQDREDLVAACEREWTGTPWQWRAELLRSQLNDLKRSFN